MAAWELGWWSNPALSALALLLCLLVPGVGIWALMLLFGDPVITWIVSRRQPGVPAQEIDRQHGQPTEPEENAQPLAESTDADER